jgi:hypothetical protein
LANGLFCGGTAVIVGVAHAAFESQLALKAPLYGADCLGSLFRDSVTSWNLGHLNDILHHLGKIPGVNTPYQYFGTWKSCFCWCGMSVNLISFCLTLLV